jgi:hypothetical protein
MNHDLTLAVQYILAVNDMNARLVGSTPGLEQLVLSFAKAFLNEQIQTEDTAALYNFVASIMVIPCRFFHIKFIFYRLFGRSTRLRQQSSSRCSCNISRICRTLS